MVGIFPAMSDLTEKQLTIGYREIWVIRDCLLGKAGERSRGHEFHTSRLVGPLEGLPGSTPTFARNFVATCLAWNR